ncbi:MAG TPA: beta-galactosidase [Acidimicrobiales bacterium]|nr:beta-galactosidase [Acidimicrobiales bacterium]
MSKYIQYGGDYNAEQWPRAVWEEDVALMQDAGVNLVTVGVFSWAQLERDEGSFSFGWLHDLLDLLASADISVDLATPTAAPPAWLSVRYPDVLPVNAYGARYSHGSRQAICICSPAYRGKARDIVTRLATEVGSHEAVKMWHVHNEYACHVPYCYCDNHAEAFRRWLEHRYGSLDTLNDAWGTTFWSQTYTDFGQVVPPRLTAAFVNPSLDLDYKRFSSEAFFEEFLLERAVLKEARPDLPVTSNFMGFFKPIDYFKWASQMDVVSTDNYPDTADPEWPLQTAMHYDLVRGLNKQVPWMVMEQTPSRVTWHCPNVPKRPGHMRAMSYQALARGAGGLMFFQWRASRSGAEKFHSAMVPHSGTASPVWAEVAALGNELAALEDFSALPVEAKVAVLFSWPNWWALEAPSQPAGGLTIADQLTWLYRPLYEGGVTVDFCHPDEPLNRYEAVIVPSLYLTSEQQGANLRSYVEAGGTAVVSFWSGIVDERDSVYLGPYGGPLRPLLGCDVLDVAPLPVGETLQLQWEDGREGTGAFWADVAAERDGHVLARYLTGPLSGRPALLETSYGRGRAYYIGCRLDHDTLARLYSFVPALRADGAIKRAGSGIERAVRVGTDKRYEFLINYSDEQREVDVLDGGLDLLTGTVTGPQVKLRPGEVAIVRHSHLCAAPQSF